MYAIKEEAYLRVVLLIMVFVFIIIHYYYSSPMPDDDHFIIIIINHHHHHQSHHHHHHSFIIFKIIKRGSVCRFHSKRKSARKTGGLEATTTPRIVNVTSAIGTMRSTTRTRRRRCGVSLTNPPLTDGQKPHRRRLIKKIILASTNAKTTSSHQRSRKNHPTTCCN